MSSSLEVCLQFVLFLFETALGFLYEGLQCVVMFKKASGSIQCAIILESNLEYVIEGPIQNALYKRFKDKSDDGVWAAARMKDNISIVVSGFEASQTIHLVFGIEIVHLE